MAENAYHQVPYITGPMLEMHPDRLAAVAMLFGMTPAPVTQCRMLEIGCGSGGNLIPMAYRLPGSRFTGIDLAELAVAEGQAAASELELPNLELIAMDLCQVGESMGQFDYIVAHGLFSWIPDPVRERLLDICRERLTPQGVVFISYNALPGRYVRTMLRDMMLYHTRDCQGPRERIQRARELLGRLSEARLVASAWQPMVDEEIRETLAGDEGALYHDDLAPINDAFYVRDFVARAERHGLQFLGDAQPHLLFDSRSPMAWVTGGVMEREQYFDFLCLRPFRQTLLCGSEVKLERPVPKERMDGFWFSSPARKGNGHIEGLHSVRLPNPSRGISRVATAMAAVYPVPLLFEELVSVVSDRETLRGILLGLISSGFASFHTYAYASLGELSARPRASRLAQYENSRGGLVTTSNHTASRLDGMVRALLELADGTRDFGELATGLAAVKSAPKLAEIRARLPQVLEQMMLTGMLEG